jgi:TolB-like protein
MSTIEPSLVDIPLSEKLIDEQLQRIFVDPNFSVSDILRRFLSFIVKETLGGHSNMIKEYTIGVNVLNKPNDFKPQHDAIVRIHAGRLRRALNEYYKEAGQRDPIRISIPKGGYVPVFGNGEPQSPEIPVLSPKGKERPTRKSTTLAVLPFQHFEQDTLRISFVEGLGQQLTCGFGRFQDISIIGYYTSKQLASKFADIREFATAIGAQYIITGNVQFEAKRVRVCVQLINAITGEQNWSEVYDRKLLSSNFFGLQDDIVSSVLSVLGDYYGFIEFLVAKDLELKKENAPIPANALAWLHHFYAEFNRVAYKKSVTAMELAVKQDPEYELAWAFLGQLYLQGYLFQDGLQQQLHASELGLQCALKALEIDPLCQQAYITLAFANILRRNKQTSIESLEYALSMNQKAVSNMGQVGCLMIIAGEYERGIELLEKSIQLNRLYPSVFNLFYSLYYFRKKDYQHACYWAGKMHTPDFVWPSIIQASGLAHLNKIEESQIILKQIYRSFPDLPFGSKNFIRVFLLDEYLVDDLFKGLELAFLALNTAVA